MNIADSLFLAGAVLSVLFDFFLTVLLFLCTFLNVLWHGLRNKEKVIHVKSNMHVHLARCDRFLFNFYKCCAHCSPPFINDDMSTLLPHKNGELFAKCKACHVTFSSSHHFFFPSFPYSPCLFLSAFHLVERVNQVPAGIKSSTRDVISSRWRWLHRTKIKSSRSPTAKTTRRVTQFSSCRQLQATATITVCLSAGIRDHSLQVLASRLYSNSPLPAITSTAREEVSATKDWSLLHAPANTQGE